MRTLLRTWPYLKGHRLAAGVVLALLVVEVMAQLMIPWALKVVVDNVLGGEPLDGPLERIVPDVMESDTTLLLVAAVLGGFLLTAAAQAIRVADTYLQTRIDQAMVLRFRSALFRHAQRLSIAMHDERKAGDLVHRINYSASALGQVPMMVPHLLQAAITLVGMFIVTLTIDASLAFLSLLIIPFLFAYIRYYARAIQPRMERVIDREIESLSMVQEALTMLRVIVSFGREDHEHRRFHEHGRQTAQARLRVTFGQTLFSFAVTVTIAAGTALVLGYGAFLVIDGALTLGQLLVVLAYVAAVYAPLDTLVSSTTPLQQQIVDLGRAFGMLDEAPGIIDAPDAKSIERASGEIAFEGVSFTHRGREETLDDISFEARPGTVTAIVGPTGAGKTTLTSLMPRFYDPDEGRILLDGTDVRDIRLDDLRRQYSVVLQETLLFSASIRENIAYGDPDAGSERVIEAAEAAGAHEFIADLPEGYDTVVGEGGRGLSGGERQRISIARAFLRDSPILVLDEPTSAVDTRTEAGILGALQRLMVGRTTFIIAHRLSTVRRADRILVLRGGRVVEQGTHESLVRSDGLYRHLYAHQSGDQGRSDRMVHGLPTTARPSVLPTA